MLVSETFNITLSSHKYAGENRCLFSDVFPSPTCEIQDNKLAQVIDFFTILLPRFRFLALHGRDEKGVYGSYRLWKVRLTHDRVPFQFRSLFDPHPCPHPHPLMPRSPASAISRPLFIGDLDT